MRACTTVHANAAADVPARLEALGALAGLTREALAAQAASAVHAVLHLRRDRGRRRLAEIATVGRDPGSGTLVVRTALAAGSEGEVAAGPGWAGLAGRLARVLPAGSPVAVDGPPAGRSPG